MEINNTYENDSDVNLRAVFGELLSKIPLILVIAVFAALVTYYINAFVITPMYTSETKIYVLARDGSDSVTVTTGELQAGELLTRDYEDIIKSRQVLERVISELDLRSESGAPMSYESILGKITVKTTTGKRILVIQVVNPNPLLAQQIADSVRNVSAEQIQSIMDTKTVKTVDTANLPRIPSSPHTIGNSVKAGIAGFLVGSIFFFILILQNDTIREEDDIERYLKLSSLGSIPKYEEQKSLKKKNSQDPASVPEGMISIQIPKQNYEEEEAFRTLRTNLQFCGVDKKVVAITSCLPNEGKSSVAIRLAISLAGIGKRTVFVDADMRKSVMMDKLHTYGRKVNGLSELLSGQTSLSAVAFQTNVENLTIITSGFFPPNPTELLSGPIFKKLLDTLRAASDYVIIDCPPLGSVIDSAVIAKECDGTILIVDSGNISYHFAQDVVKQLERSNCPILGGVLNKVDTHHRRGRYYGKYYGRYFGRYYSRYYKRYYGKYSSKSQDNNDPSGKHYNK